MPTYVQLSGTDGGKCANLKVTEGREKRLMKNTE
jgi:hypothetical protein